MAKPHRRGFKWSVPRHRKQVATSADRQERAIERQERQAAQKEVRKELKNLGR